MAARTLEQWIRTARTLLPAGRLFELAAGADLRKWLTPMMEELRILLARADDAVRELDPAQTSEMLPEWEHDWGLPESCASATAGALTEAQRRENLLEKINRVGSANALDIQRLLALHGLAATVADRATDPTIPAHYIRADLPGGTPAQRAVMACVLDQVLPAHVARVDSPAPPPPANARTLWTAPEFSIPKSWDGQPYQWPDATRYYVTFDSSRLPQTGWPLTENLTVAWQIDPAPPTGTVDVAVMWAGNAPTPASLATTWALGSIVYHFANRWLLVYPIVRAWRSGDPTRQRLTIVLSRPGTAETVTGYNDIIRTDG